MQTFQAVVTTGIYCRPDCSARPDPANVVPYGLAAAAEAAGFRACLRCRPYRSSQPLALDAPELVCRAVRLVVEGALDSANEADLASRLGVSGRHLRRLFSAHVGATPDELARSRRAHFARRLLDDTDLSVTDIAFAAGYGSVRQLNRACLDVFRASPRELRRKRRRSDRLVADGGLSLRLPFSGPFELESFFSYMATRAIPGVESVDDRSYRRTIVIDGDPGVLELVPGGADHVVLRAHLPHWHGLIHIVERVRRVLGLDADVEQAARVLGGDPLLGPMLAARPGLRVNGAWDPFETAVRTILGQQVSVRAASTLAGRLVERFGEAVPGLGALGLTHTFPTPELLRAADMSGLGITGARQESIRALAAALEDGSVRLDGSAGLDELVSSITALPGLGPWSAHYLAMRLGEGDAFPASDLGLRQAAGLSARELEERAEGWRPWRALAAVHLWASLVPVPDGSTA